MRRIISVICANTMMLGGGYFAITLAAHLMHWVVIISAGVSVLGLLWLWEDFLSPLMRRGRARHADHKENDDGSGLYRRAA